jgi:hypothetical protein
VRATVWRRVKSLGGIYLHAGVAAIPATRETERALRLIHHMVELEGGSGVLIKASVIGDERALRAAYDAVRNDEYSSFADRLGAFVQEVHRDLDNSRTIYPVLSRHDRRFGELRKELAGIEANDYFGAEAHREAVDALARAETALERFAAVIYLREERA